MGAMCFNETAPMKARKFLRRHAREPCGLGFNETAPMKARKSKAARCSAATPNCFNETAPMKARKFARLTDEWEEFVKLQ